MFIVPSIFANLNKSTLDMAEPTPLCTFGLSGNAEDPKYKDTKDDVDGSEKVNMNSKSPTFE